MNIYFLLRNKMGLFGDMIKIATVNFSKYG